MKSQATVSTLIKSEVFSGILMVVSFALALSLANVTFFSEFYVKLVFLPISFGVGSLTYHTTLINLVNDGLMTLFFLLIGLELKYHLVLGEYRERKTLILPAFAAIGGVVVPALIYGYFNYNQPTLKGWAIPIASDTAFMLGILSFFAKHVSAKFRAFVISFSLIDDALAIGILALFYTKSLDISAFCTSLVLVVVLIVLNRLKVSNSLYYFGIGILLWACMVEAGIHGTLCGAIVALTIPAKINERPNPSFRELENIFRPLVCYYILPLFVFMNSGVRFNGFSLETLISNVSIGIILGLFIGKQIGIISFCYMAVHKKWCILPSETTWMKFYAVCILSGIGFTLSLFIGDLTFEASKPHYAMRSAVLIGSLLSAFFGTLLFAYSVRPKNTSLLNLMNEK